MYSIHTLIHSHYKVLEDVSTEFFSFHFCPYRPGLHILQRLQGNFHCYSPMFDAISMILGDFEAHRDRRCV